MSSKSEANKNVLVKYLEDKLLFKCSLNQIKDRTSLKEGDVRRVKWLDKKFYTGTVTKIGSDGQIEFKFKRGKGVFTTNFADIENASVLQEGDVRHVKWKDGHYYPAKILSLGQDPLEESAKGLTYSSKYNVSPPPSLNVVVAPTYSNKKSFKIAPTPATTSFVEQDCIPLKSNNKASTQLLNASSNVDYSAPEVENQPPVNIIVDLAPISQKSFEEVSPMSDDTIVNQACTFPESFLKAVEEQTFISTKTIDLESPLSTNDFIDPGLTITNVEESLTSPNRIVETTRISSKSYELSSPIMNTECADPNSIEMASQSSLTNLPSNMENSSSPVGVLDNLPCSKSPERFSCSFSNPDFNQESRSSDSFEDDSHRSNSPLFSNVSDDDYVDVTYEPDSCDERDSSDDNLPQKKENTSLKKDNLAPMNNGEHTKDSAFKQHSKRHKTAKKKYSYKKNKNACYYCGNMVLDFARHITRNHSHEHFVQKIISSKKGIERTRLLGELRKKGNFIQSSIHSIKPVKKLTSPSPSKLANCPYCLGFYARRHLWRHKKTCHKNKGKKITDLPIDDINKVLTKSERDHKELVDKVFSRMHPSEGNKIAKEDPLICAYGVKYLKTHRDKHQAVQCSRKMRELAFILIEIKKINPGINNLLQALKPDNFENLLEASKRASGFNHETGQFRDAAYAMNVSTGLKECCEIAIIEAIKKKHSSEGQMYIDIEKELNTTIFLIKSQWNSEISHSASNHLHGTKMNAVSLVPLATDLKKLKDYLEQVAETSVKELKKDPTCYKSYRTLVECTYGRVMLLCRKRPGELQRMTVEQYTSANPNQSYQELNSSLTSLERILVRSFKRVVIKGKRRATPVLFSKDVQDHINLILEVRGNFLEESNNFLFGTKKNCILGYRIMPKYAKLAECQRPESIHTRSLRKHLATICQLFSMSDGDIEQLATFMGHTTNIHKQDYRIPDDTFQTAKITKMLMMLERGEGASLKGKSFNEIDIPLEDKIVDVESDLDEDLELPLEDILSPVGPSTSDQLCAFGNVKQQYSKQKKKREFHKWTYEQKQLVTEFFQQEIELKKAPKKDRVLELYARYPNVPLPKEWDKIKVLVQNIYTKKLKTN